MRKATFEKSSLMLEAEQLFHDLCLNGVHELAPAAVSFFIGKYRKLFPNKKRVLPLGADQLVHNL